MSIAIVSDSACDLPKDILKKLNITEVPVNVTFGDKTYKTLKFNFSSTDPSLSKDKKLNIDIWYEEDTYLWIKAAFDKTGFWEYRLKEFR